MAVQHEFSFDGTLKQLNAGDRRFIEVLVRGGISAELYKPDKVDLQTPHYRDEFYVVVSGTGTFINAGRKWNFKPGDLLFVPAGIEHRFVDFTDDFATWVIFI